MIPQEIYSKENSTAKAEAVKLAAIKFDCRDGHINAVLRGAENPKNARNIKEYFLEKFYSIKGVLIV